MRWGENTKRSAKSSADLPNAWCAACPLAVRSGGLSVLCSAAYDACSARRRERGRMARKSAQMGRDKGCVRGTSQLLPRVRRAFGALTHLRTPAWDGDALHEHLSAKAVHSGCRVANLRAQTTDDDKRHQLHSREQTRILQCCGVLRLKGRSLAGRSLAELWALDTVGKIPA